MTNVEMTCKELVELVTEYLEETLPSIDRARFETHVAGCPYCNTYLQQMRETICMVGKLTEDTVSPEARQEMLDIFRDWNAGQCR